MSRGCSFVARLAVVFGFLGGFLTLTAQPAFAWCEGDPPPPVPPDDGVVGWFVDDPAGAEVPPEQADPFQPDARYSVSDVYGWSTHWGTYDLGCGPDAAKAPTANPFTALANIALIPPKWGGVATSWWDHLTENLPLGWLDQLVADTNDKILNTIWKFWFPVTLLLVGLYVLWKARRAEYAETSTSILVVVLVLVASVFFLVHPQRAMDLMDAGLAKVSEIAAKPFGGDNMESLVMENMIYPTWLSGQFGDSDSVAARKYGPDIYWSTHYTWAEVERIEADPNAAEEINAEKRSVYENVASRIKEEDPAAYRHFTGNAAGNRLAAAFGVYPFVAFAVLFILLGAVLVAVAHLAVKGFVIGMPLIGLLAAHPSGRTHLQQLWDYFAAAGVALFKFTFLVGLFTTVTGALLASDSVFGDPTAPGVDPRFGLNPLAKLFFLIVLTVIFLMVAKPLRSMKAMIPGANPNYSILGAGIRKAINYAVHRHAASSGVRQALDEHDGPAASPAEQPVHTAASAEETTMPALPPPPYANAGAVGAQHRQAALGSGPAWGPPDPGKVRVEWGTPHVDPGQALRNHDAAVTLGVTPTEAKALPAAPVSTSREQTTPDDPTPTSRPIGPAPGPPGEPTPTSPAAEGVAQLAPRRRQVVNEAGEPIYHREQARQHTEDPIDLPLAERQLDRDGNEVHVIYTRADRGMGR